ncbi:ATP-binding cassette sub-family G member 5-like [Mercenaria mercenaria]|uniref:ATP-binding cassette sub-family G member 5-like n=1 Tax=Mercenaria mercenaria TaxID=6596 RepID=UPI00234E47AF|nr:ATP-binding cassette sub-family G member 5-like [Mercenaria mercenaria]
MDTRLIKSNNLGSYGSTAFSSPNGFPGAKGMHFDKNSNKVSPITDAPVGQSTLNVSNVFYVVKEWVGPWWTGACFRKTRRKIVLRDISLQVKAGEITAILGNSGSGKTSLLDVISCRSSGAVSGQVCFNNVRCTRDVVQQHATYVMQADRLLPNLTVRETLRYTARLKLPGNIKTNDIEQKVSKVIQQMGLKDVADSRIGSSIIRGISGGEQRRVTIAIQLLKDPDMVLLDEPTSGLDSYTARYLVKNLRDLAQQGKIVLLTIHQPSSDIFHMFDEIGIMSQGQMVYCGPGKEMVPYFTSLGYPCDRYTNPLDRYVDVSSIDRRDLERQYESTKRVGSLVEAFQNSSIYHQTLNSITEATNTLDVPLSYKGLTKPSGPSFARVLFTLVGRMYTNVFRDRKDYFARIFLLPLFMVFILIFLGRLKHTQSSIQDRIGLIYNATTAPPFMGIINSIALFLCLRNLYYRESRDGLYGSATFLIAYSIHVIPFNAASSIIFSSIIYWVTGLYPSADRFGIFTLEVFILHYWGEMLTVACLGMFMNPNLANSVAALLQSATVIIASGYVKTLGNLVKPLEWLSWVLIHKYSAEIFIANEFKDLKLDCDRNVTLNCIENGNSFIDAYFPGADDHIARNFGCLVAYSAGTLIFAILVFKLAGLRNLH